MISNDAINPLERITPMAKTALKKLSFGLEIIAWEVRPMQAPQPGWGIVYYVKSMLLNQPPLGNMTFVTDPFVTAEALEEAIGQGLTALRQRRAQQLNGRTK